MYYIVQAVIIIVITGLAYKTTNLIFESRRSNKFVIKGVNSAGVSQGEKRDYKVYLQKYSLVERMLLIGKYQEYLSSLLQAARIAGEPKDIIRKQLAFGMTTLILIFVIYLSSQINVFLYLAIPASLLSSWIPIKNLKKASNYYAYQMKIQLPDYLSHFAILLKSYNPFEATQRSIDYAGPLLKKNVEKLVTQLSLYPSSSRPYIEFAEDIGLREAKDFMLALQQIMKVDSESADRVIENQILILDELQEEAYQEQIETRPDEVEKYISPMLYPFIVVIFVMVGVLMLNTFSNNL